MEVTAVGEVRPEALREIAKPLAVAGRDVASSTLIDDATIPQAGLGLSLQAVISAAGKLGGLDLLDIAYAYGTAFASLVIHQSENPAVHNRLLADFNDAARGAFMAACALRAKGAGRS